MKTRFFATAAIAVLLLNVVGFGFADTRRTKANHRQANALVSLLPASDAILGIDSRRFFSQAMPQILASNQPMLNKIMAQLEDVQAKTGIDLRKFESAAVGLALVKVKDNQYDFDPVAIARGDINTATLVAVAKLASNGTYREEKIGDRTIYVFTAKSAKAAAQTATGKVVSPATDGMIEKAINGLTKEMAVTSLDANTMAFGSLARVRATIEATTKVSPELSAMLTGKENTVMAFALKTPDGMSKLLPLDNDELGANIDSIRYVSGSMDVTGLGTSFQVTAQTLKAEQAQGLSETLEGLKALGKMFLGSSKRADQKIYAKMIESAKITRTGNNVSLDLLVAQPDIDALVGAMK